MKQSLGLIEVRGLAAAVYIADVMIKTANVKLLSLEKTKGIGWMVIKITGNVGAVNAAINSGKQASIEKNEFVTCKVIPRPADLTEDFFCKEEVEKIKEKKESEKDSGDKSFQEKVNLKKVDEKEPDRQVKENNIQVKKIKKAKNNLAKDSKKNNEKVEKKDEK